MKRLPPLRCVEQSFMKPGRLDLPIIWRGCDWPIITFRWKSLEGNPFNLNGWVPYASTNKFNLNASLSDPDHGVTILHLTREQTAALPLGVLSWSWLWTHTATSETLPPLLEGSVTVKQPTKKT